MTQNAVGFEASRNGREWTSDGLHLHRGRLVVRQDGGTTPPSFTYVQTFPGDTPQRLSVGGWERSHIRIDEQYPAEPRIGFHESGHTALTLYKPSGQASLRIRTNDGADWPIAGAPGSATAFLGYWFAPSGWAVPAVNQWYETDVRVQFTATGGIIRAEAGGVLNCPTGGSLNYVGLGFDGSLTYPSLFCGQPPRPDGTLVPFHVTAYWNGGYSPGVHRVGVFVNANVANATMWSAANASLWCTEIRC